MYKKHSKIFVIAGPKGSGKTMSAKKLLPEILLPEILLPEILLPEILLPEILQCYEYVNADAVAAALSPFHPEEVAMLAGRYNNSEIESKLIANRLGCNSINIADKTLWLKINERFEMKTTDEKFNLAARIDYGVKAGVREAILEHKRAGVAIVVLKNGKVVEIPPEKIEVDDDLPPSPI